jgi:hypothetical protein
MIKFDLESFLEWKFKLHSEYRGGKLMYDISNYYKWLYEEELFVYYMRNKNI